MSLTVLLAAEAAAPMQQLAQELAGINKIF